MRMPERERFVCNTEFLKNSYLFIKLYQLELLDCSGFFFSYFLNGSQEFLVKIEEKNLWTRKLSILSH